MGYHEFGNPICSCQFQLLGGWRRQSVIFITIFLVLLGAMVLYRTIPQNTNIPALTSHVLKGLSVLQMGVFILGGSSAIASAVWRDNNTRMMEVMRTSPMSSFSVVFGYLFGSTIQMTLTALMIAVYGIFLIISMGQSVSSWLASNAYLAVISVSIWSAVLFFALGRPPGKRRGGAGIVWMIILVTTGQVWLLYVSALGLLSGAIALVWCFHAMVGQPTNNLGFGVSLSTCAIMLVFWYRASMRRYRFPYLTGLSVPGALLFLVIWTSLALLGFILRSDLLPPGLLFGEAGIPLLITTLISMQLGMLIPLAIACKTRLLAIYGCPNMPGRLSQSPLWIAVVSSSILAAGLFMMTQAAEWDPTRAAEWGIIGASRIQWALTATAFCCAAVMACGLWRVSYFLVDKQWLAILAVFFLWGVPLLDFIRVATLYQGEMPLESFSSLFACSPIGTIIAAWAEMPIALWACLLFQGVFAIILNALGMYLEHLRSTARKKQLHAEHVLPARPG